MNLLNNPDLLLLIFHRLNPGFLLSISKIVLYGKNNPRENILKIHLFELVYILSLLFLVNLYCYINLKFLFFQ